MNICQQLAQNQSFAGTAAKTAISAHNPFALTTLAVTAIE
jgi:hypothetical protein